MPRADVTLKIRLPRGSERIVAAGPFESFFHCHGATVHWKTGLSRPGRTEVFFWTNDPDKPDSYRFLAVIGGKGEREDKATVDAIDKFERRYCRTLGKGRGYVERALREAIGR